MEPVLTHEELDAIHSAMKADGEMPAAVDDIVLTSGRGFAARAIDSWTELFQSIAPRMEGLIGGVLGFRVEIEPFKPVLLGATTDDEPDSTPEDTDLPPRSDHDGSSVKAIVSLGDRFLVETWYIASSSGGQAPDPS